MRFAKLLALSVILISVILPTRSAAIEVEQPPAGVVKTDSPLLITGYALTKTQLGYVQLYNSSDEVLVVDNWQVYFTTQESATLFPLATLHGLIKPGGYIVLADVSVVPNADVLFTPLPGGVTLTSLRITSPTFLDHNVAVKSEANVTYWKRTISSVTGKYLTTFTAFQPDGHFVLYGNGFYEYPVTAELQVTEILANPRQCSPLETAGDCRDFIKLYNPTASEIDLSQYRLRIGYQGQTTSASNTFSLTGILPPGGYYAFSTTSDNRRVSVTNSGGYVWLEDSYGIKRYDATIVEYPDASADSKKGHAWAYDITDGVWKWTTQPTPLNAPSVFPAPLPTAAKVSGSSGLVPCKEGQYRSEETNRCRSIASTAASSLTPCSAGQERNPETNRCRKIATATSQLTPCKEGQERNPDTNRCRNVANTTPPSAAYGVEAVADTGMAFAGWWALGGIGLVAAGYGAWEWRHEVMESLRKIGAFFTSSK